MAESPQPPATPSQALVIEQDAVCAQCSYNLRGLPTDGTCPECGASVADSLATAGNVYRRWLHFFAIAMVVMIFFLIIAGGTVTTYGYGLAVPDWPTSYGKWFLLPLDLWRQVPIFWEHNHRLIGATVGLMAIFLVPSAFLADRRWWMGAYSLALLLLIIIQGLMGGFRVTEISLTLAIIHGIVGQMIFALTVFGAAALSKWWITRSRLTAREVAAFNPEKTRSAITSQDRFVAVALLVLLVGQLTLGALVRHHEAGLAIPDFPTSYGGVMPPMSQDALNTELAKLPEGYSVREKGLEVWQVHLHFGHRLGALVVFCWALWVAARMMRIEKMLPKGGMKGPLIAFGVLLLLQISLGVLVIWTGRHAEVTTAHQSVGAALLGTATLLVARMFRLDYLTRSGLAAPTTTEAGAKSDASVSTDFKGAPA